MSYYNLNAIDQQDVLVNSRQYQLTLTSTFKILETGVHADSQYFVVRLIRNFEYANGNPYVLYVDMSKDEFDQITKEACLIRYLLKNEINKTIFQTPNVHVWTQRPPKNEPNKPAMLCVRGSDGTRIYITQRTFNRLFNRMDSVDRAYDRFMDLEDYSYSSSDSDHEEQSSDDSSDDCYYN